MALQSSGNISPQPTRKGGSHCGADGYHHCRIYFGPKIGDSRRVTEKAPVCKLCNDEVDTETHRHWACRGLERGEHSEVVAIQKSERLAESAVSSFRDFAIYYTRVCVPRIWTARRYSQHRRAIRRRPPSDHEQEYHTD